MSKSKNTILNVGSAGIDPLDLPDSYFLINLDKEDFFYQERIETVLKELREYRETFTNIGRQTSFIQMDAWTFYAAFPFKFDRIVMYRFLEHISRCDMLNFLYNTATTLEIGGTLDIIVPDHQELARYLVNETIEDIKDQAHDILLTTEFQNEPEDPHASLWSADRAKYYLELEGRFKITSIQKHFEFDGRDIYIRVKAVRVK